MATSGWQGNTGSLSWWLPVKMDEVERHKQKLTAPDADAWNNQMYKVRVFNQLVGDTDISVLIRRKSGCALPLRSPFTHRVAEIRNLVDEVGSRFFTASRCY
jgi:hypothetical protein